MREKVISERDLDGKKEIVTDHNESDEKLRRLLGGKITGSHANATVTMTTNSAGSAIKSYDTAATFRDKSRVEWLRSIARANP